MDTKRRDFCKATLIGGSMVALPAANWRSFAAEPAASGGIDIPAIKLSGEPTVIPAATVKQFAANLHGRLLSASDQDYDQARRLWNKMIDRRPALIARCSGAADVVHAVAFAREQGLLVAVRGGGHSFPGYSMCNGGLVIDLSEMRGVRVDPIAKTARVAGGAWIGDLDWESEQYGLATPMGSVSNTGVAGLTLGGGYGWLSRSYGLACDNLISVDLITADAKLQRVSASENPDLFWAIHGGGGNFGIVSSFEYRLHPVGPQVLAGSLIYAPAQTREVLEYYGPFAARAPRELAVWLDWGGSEGDEGDLTLTVCYVGDPRQGEKLLQPLHRRRRWHNQRIARGRVVGIVLRSHEEESLVLANWRSCREPRDVVHEYRSRSTVQAAQIVDRIEDLRLIAPIERTVQVVRAGFGHQVQDAAGCASEFHAEVRGLHGDFLNRIGDIERLSNTCVLDVVIVSAIEQEVIAGYALPVYRILYSYSASQRRDRAAGGLDDSRNRPGKR